MTANRSFRVREPDVIFEVFDNEVVLINLANGNYYSLQGPAAEIWGLLKAGVSQKGIVNQVMNRYQGVQKEVDRAIDAFLDELSEDGLVEPFQPEERVGKNDGEEAAPSAGAPDRPAFVVPVLNRYTDMQNLLLLDPIHDIGDEGWPNPKTDASPQSD